MSRKRNSARDGDRPRLGERPPLYRFVLNPYVDARFTTCPGCEHKMGQRKVPLLIHVMPRNPVVLNYTCRYCRSCDLLIAHQDEIQALLSQIFSDRPSPITPKDYLVLGTLDRANFRQSLKVPLEMQELPSRLHDFKDVLTLKVTGGWVYQGPKKPGAGRG
jgi:hypothetical protein